MSGTVTRPPRDRFIDALRGLALCGVLVVNSLSYPHVFSSPIGVVDPPGSGAALAVLSIAAALFQAKSYPLLMFLVGYAWAMRMRRHRGPSGDEPISARRRQMWRQGALGVMHGLFVYFGDILSWLALLGLILLRAPSMRLRALRRRAAVWGALWIAFAGSSTLWVVLDGHPMPGQQGHWLTEARTWPEVFDLERLAYGSFLFQAHVQLPMMITLGSLGVMAGRLRVLERARVGAALWKTAMRWWLPAGLVANLLLSVWVVMLAHFSGGDFTPSDLSSQFAGPLLAAGVVGLLAHAWHRGRARWLLAFAPLGRLTMSCYLAHTLTCLLLFAGPAAALAPRFGSVGLFFFGLGFWLLAVCIAPVWQAYVGAGPFERWVRGGAAGRRSGSRRNTIT